MKRLETDEEKLLFTEMKNGDNAAFRKIFDAYYKYLTVTAYRYLHDGEKAKDIAQDSFVELWNRKESLSLTTGLKAYLRQTTVNKCLNYLKREKRMDFSEPAMLPETPAEAVGQKNLEYEQTKNVIQNAVDNLPERCRIIFCMSRFEEKSHKEIAAALNISVKTIENQMTRALKALRAAVAKNTVLFIFFSEMLLLLRNAQ